MARQMATQTKVAPRPRATRIAGVVDMIFSLVWGPVSGCLSLCTSNAKALKIQHFKGIVKGKKREMFWGVATLYFKLY